MVTILDKATKEPSESSTRGVRLLDAKTARFQKRLVLVVTVTPFLGLIAAVATLWGRALGTVEVALFATMFLIAGFGITVGFHRLFTHQSFQTKPWVGYVLAIAGSMAMQGPVIRWVADHRRHHAFSDQPGDPHSPHLDEGPGIRGVVKGLWHSHMGWLFSDEQTSAKRWAPDLVKDPAMRRIDRLFPLWAALSVVSPALIGLIVTGTFAGAASAFLWGSLVRIFVLHHVTWSVNSICHFYGNRPYQNMDFSTNNWVLSLISLGESWHNNHHAFPSSAIHGLRPYQIDLSAGFIRTLKVVGLAWDIKTATSKQIATKSAA